jgi:hypothetical protein
MKITICVLIAAILVNLPSVTIAGDINFTADVSATDASVGEQITLELSLSGGVQNLPTPDDPKISNCTVYSAGTSQQFSYTNGVLESSIKHSYILIPQKEGKLIIPSQTVKYKGETYSTKPITINVMPSGSGQPEQQASPQSNPSRSSGGNRDFFVEAFADKDTAYVNEQVTLTFRFYRARRLYSEPTYEPPSATGFWVEDLPPQKNYYKTVNGRNYYVAEVKTGLFPTSPGTKTVGKATLRISGEDLLSPFDRHDPFGLFGGRRHKTPQPVTLVTKPIEVFALPLPAEGRPSDFSGSVGDFSMQTTIDRTDVEVNQPVTVKIKLSGKGNIKTLTEPDLPELENFRVFKSGGSQNVSKAGYVVGGSKTFEISFVAKEPGNYTLPAFSTNYFDPEEETYKTLGGRTFEISVSGVSNEEIASRGDVNHGRLDLVATDIRYIFTDREGGTDAGPPLALRTWFVGLNALPVLAVIAVVAIRRRKDRLEGDLGYRRLKQAAKMARRRLADASAFLNSGDSDSFYSEINRALTEYLGDKFNLAATGLTNETILSRFDSRPITSDMAEDFFSIAAECDEARFAPSGKSADSMKSMLERAQRWIVQFEGLRE